MNLMQLDEHNSYHTMVIATVCGYGKDEQKATLHVQLPYMDKECDILEDVELLMGYGGLGYGFLHRPEIGDQVLLTFLGNQNKKAIALGVIVRHDSAVWNLSSAKNEQKAWQFKNGSKLTIWDEADHNKLEFSCKDHQMIMDEEQQRYTIKSKDASIVFNGKEDVLTLQAVKELQICCGDSSICMKKDGAILIKGKKIHIEGQELMTKTNMNTTIQAQNAAIEAKLETKVQGKAGVKIESNGISEIKGGLVKLG